MTSSIITREETLLIMGVSLTNGQRMLLDLLNQHRITTTRVFDAPAPRPRRRASSAPCASPRCPCSKFFGPRHAVSRPAAAPNKCATSQDRAELLVGDRGMNF